MSKPVIISGEASETESENESSTYTKTPPVMTASIQAAMIAGEDSESDNEDGASICSAVSALAENSGDPRGATKREECNGSESLLHQKLRECNGKLHGDLESFWQGLIGDAGKNLNSIDQQLMKSQITLQSAVTSLKSLTANSLALKTKLQSLLSAQFIPNINVNVDK